MFSDNGLNSASNIFKTVLSIVLNVVFYILQKAIIIKIHKHSSDIIFIARIRARKIKTGAGIVYKQEVPTESVNIQQTRLGTVHSGGDNLPNWFHFAELPSLHPAPFKSCTGHLDSQKEEATAEKLEAENYSVAAQLTYCSHF